MCKIRNRSNRRLLLIMEQQQTSFDSSLPLNFTYIVPNGDVSTGLWVIA